MSVLDFKEITAEDLKDGNLTALNDALRSMRDELLRLGGYYGAIQLTSDIDLGGHKIINEGK